MEIARRWSGFVCPDCRFVFRVPRDHDGHGVVCPSCRRMLKIPAPEDETPPLVVPPPVSDSTGTAGAAPTGRGGRRRKKKARHGDDHEWERSRTAKARSSSRREKRQMIWMLVGGCVLLALMVAGVLFAMLGGRQPLPVAETPTIFPPAAEVTAISDVPLSDAAFLAEAEPLAGKFLSATRIEELLPLVRQPAKAEPRMRALHPAGTFTAPGMNAFNSQAEVVRDGSILSVKVRTGAYEEKTLSFLPSPDGLRIDWESWAGWSDVPWTRFITEKPSSPALFRVMLSQVEYYNFAFTDDRKWQSYRIESPDGAHALYGYTERGSTLAARLRPPSEKQQIPMMLTLKFPEKATSGNQVLIDGLIAEGWVLQTE